MPISIAFDGSTSLLTAAWTEVTSGVDQIMTNDYAKLGLLLPLVGLVIGVAKKLFRSRRG